jgi:hypothetical protein
VSTKLEYQLRVRNGDDSADLFVITSVANGTNPYIAEPPTGDGESLDPLTGQVSVGAYTIRVIDAVDTVAYDALAASDGFEYADLTALDTAWPETDTIGDAATWSLETSVIDSGAQSAELAISGVADDNNTDAYRTRTFTGLEAGVLHTVSVRCWLNFEAAGSLGIAFGIEVDGGTEAYMAGDGPINAWRTLTATGTANGSGELTVRIGAFHAFGSTTYDRLARFDTLEIRSGSNTAEARIITGYLADAEAKQQLLSKRAYIEEREDEGSWTTISAGYVTDLALVDALTYEFSIGSTQRIEQSKRVFDRVPSPADYPEISSKHDGTAQTGTLPTLDRASCLIGGPIIGHWGPSEDRGRPVFEVKSVDGQIVVLEWIEGFVSNNFAEREPPLRGEVTAFINQAGLEYLDSQSAVGYNGGTVASLSGLVCRLWDVSSGEWVSDHLPLAWRPDASMLRRFLGDWVFCLGSVRLIINWTGETSPSAGDRYRLAVFPKSISERNPFHVSGHPVDIAASLLTSCGLSYDSDSASDTKAALGANLTLHLRVTEGNTLIQFLEETLFGPFGFAMRLNDDGDQEFFLTRQVGASSVGTITLDDLHSDEGVVWKLGEESAANRVVWESKSFLVNDAAGSVNESTPIDCVQEATVTVEVTPKDASTEHAVYGDREIRYTLPGEIEGYYTGTQEDPGPLDYFVAALAGPLFDWQGRGAIRGELHALRESPAYTAKIGETLTLDLPHYPSAVIGDTPPSQRGSEARRAFILQRTRTPEGATVAFEDRGPAEDPGLVPTFTLAADETFPHTVVEVTVTNEADLLGYAVRVEMLTAAVEPSAAQFVRMWTPGNGDNPFDLPPVCAGSVVWVRMRVESSDGEVGQWSGFQSLDLDDLTAPSSLSTEIHGTQVTVTWTNGETDQPVEILARLTTDTEYTVVNVLPAGSTSYTWTLPDPEAEYTIGVRYRTNGPGDCVSLLATTTATTEASLTLSPPINPVAWADGRGTFGMEVDGTAFPSATEFWVKVDTLGADYALMGEQVTTETRMRFTNPFIAANDGKLRLLIARHKRGTEFSEFTDPVSINPWTLVDPPEDPAPSDPQTPGLTEIPVELVFLGADMRRRLWAVPEDETEIAIRDKYPLTNATHARAVVESSEGSTLPDTCQVAFKFRDLATGTWQFLDGISGPFVTVDGDSFDAADPYAVTDSDTVRVAAGDYVEIVPEALDDVPLKAVISGGDGDAGKYLAGARIALQLVAQDTADIEEPETQAPAPEDPGSCDTPSPIDMDTGWTGGDATGIAWTDGGDQTYTATLDGTGTGENAWEKTLTGLEPDQLYTFYLTVTTDEPDVEPFLEVVGGDTAVATGSETLVARGTTDCDGEITLRWGVEALESSPTGEGSDTLQYADVAAAIAAGWSVTDSNPYWAITFNTGHSIAGSGLDSSIEMGRAGHGGGVSSTTMLMTRVFNVGAGTAVKGKLWAEGVGSQWAGLELRLLNTAGQQTVARNRGNEGVEHLQAATAVTAGGDGLITVRIQMDAPVGGPSSFHFAGLVLEGVTGGGATVVFTDLGYCLGSGVGDGGTGLGGDPDTPGNEEIPDPPPGGWPDPPTPLDRFFGIHDIPVEGFAYWNNTVKRATPRAIVNLINAARTAGTFPFFCMGPEEDWLVGGRFSFDAWKDQMDELYADAPSRAALEAAIADGTAAMHYVIDEPFHKTRYGGPIPFATVERMFAYSKTLYPTWRTGCRVDPTDSRLVRAWVGCDTMWGEYKLSQGSITAYKSSRIEAAQDLGVDLIFGIHYAAFTASRSGVLITPDQLRHYGGELARTSFTIGLCGWKYRAELWAQPGFPEAVRYVRDLYASYDP